MFVIRQGVDCREARELGEIFDVLLGEGPNDRAMHHPAEDAGGVSDGFAPAELNIIGIQEKGIAAEFVDSNFEGEPGAG